MSYVEPKHLAVKMIDAGEAKIFMSTRDTLIRSYMAGAILALAAAFGHCAPRFRRGHAHPLQPGEDVRLSALHLDRDVNDRAVNCEP